MHLADTLNDSIFILLPLESVVLDIVNHLEVPQAPEGVNKLIQ